MEKNICKNCIHYRQHYTFDEKKIFRVYCGHCAQYPAKRKKPDTAACEHFIPAPPDENAFVSKEYLSKALLQYLLNLEFLPPIEDSKELRK